MRGTKRGGKEKRGEKEGKKERKKEIRNHKRRVGTSSRAWPQKEGQGAEQYARGYERTKVWCGLANARSPPPPSHPPARSQRYRRQRAALRRAGAADEAVFWKGPKKESRSRYQCREKRRWGRRRVWYLRGKRVTKRPE
jgi:hypothetical protein